MSDDGMLYDPKIISTLVSELQDNFGRLVAAGEDMANAKARIEGAWSASALGGFQTAYQVWRDEYDGGGDASQGSLHTLNRIAQLVEQAMHSAIGADKKIGDGFGGY
ncbi:hypothetical protein [Nocardia acidivorans]|uniref:hypothetical protein n=1 Tax=Nocardia acidivorans TaxID=404580 RepID=UPI000835FF37|nr:hypothetical protein [Nocardia acidivorans]